MADTGPPTDSGDFQTLPATAGGNVSVQYAKRVMRMYAINESEAATISSFNAQATAYFTLASFVIGVAISIYTNGVFYRELTPAGELAEKFAAPFLLLMGVALIWLARDAIKRRANLWTSIKNESE